MYDYEFTTTIEFYGGMMVNLTCHNTLHEAHVGQTEQMQYSNTNQLHVDGWLRVSTDPLNLGNQKIQQHCHVQLNEVIVMQYGSPGHRRMWGPASQPGVVLNFLDSSRSVSLSVFNRWPRKQCNAPVLYRNIRCRIISFQICSYGQISSQAYS